MALHGVSKLSLAFHDRALEKQFAEHLGKTVRMQFRIAWVGAVAVIAAVAFIDPLIVTPEQVSLYYWARYGVTIPVVGSLLVFTFFAPQSLFSRWHQLVGGLGVLGVQIGTVGTVWLTTPVTRDGFHYACIATVLTIVATHTIGGLRF